MHAAFLAALAFAAAGSPNPFETRNRGYDALHYALDVRLTEDGRFDNSVTLRFKTTSSLSTLELDAWGLDIQGATVNGQAATWKIKGDPAALSGTVTLALPKPIAAGKEAALTVRYFVKAAASHEGLAVVRDPDRAETPPIYFTHLEPTYARRFFPCNDQPGDKATFELKAVTPPEYRVISNGLKTLDETFSDSGKSLRKTQWSLTQPQATYLFAFAAGPFEEVSADGVVPARVHVLPGKGARAIIAADALKALLRLEMGIVGGKFPWPKLDLVAIPGFAWSGMENTSAIFQRESKTLVDSPQNIVQRPTIVGLLAHEIAHQWFGDLVTPKTWEDVWLNEGFARYLGGLAEDAYNTERVFGEANDEAEVSRATAVFDSYMSLDDGPRSHPLVGRGVPSPEDLFDAVSYIKGEAVLHMLEVWVGAGDFRKGLRAYLEKYAYKNANSDDFFNVMGESAKKSGSLAAFRKSWLHQRGYPVITPESKFEGGKLTVRIQQAPNHAADKSVFTFKLPMVVHRQSPPAYHQEHTLVVDRGQVSATFDVPAAPEWIDWNRGGLALARLAPGAISEREWALAARHDPDPVWRTLAAWALAKPLDGKSTGESAKLSDTAQGTLLDVLTKDSSPDVRVALLDRLSQTRAPRLPASFASALFALAKRPEGLRDDDWGYLHVRRAALATLGKVDSNEAHAYLIEELGKPEIDLNVLSAVAAGVGAIGNNAALGALRAALREHAVKGFSAYQGVALAMTKFESADGLRAVKDALAAFPANQELGKNAAWSMRRNSRLTETADFAQFVQDMVLLEGALSEEVRVAFLMALEKVKTPEAETALKTMAEKAPSSRLQDNARRLLVANFAAAPAKKVKK